jgi:hypothetical protein
MLAFLVDLGPVRRRPSLTSAVAARVAKTFGPEARPARTIPAGAALEALARTRLGVVRGANLPR